MRGLSLAVWVTLAPSLPYLLGCGTKDSKELAWNTVSGASRIYEYIPNEGNAKKKMSWALLWPACYREDWKRALSHQVNNQRMRGELDQKGVL